MRTSFVSPSLFAKPTAHDALWAPAAIRQVAQPMLFDVGGTRKNRRGPRAKRLDLLGLRLLLLLNLHVLVIAADGPGGSLNGWINLFACLLVGTVDLPLRPRLPAAVTPRASAEAGYVGLKGTSGDGSPGGYRPVPCR